MADTKHNRKELLAIAKSLDCDGKYTSFYEFAENYMANAVNKLQYNEKTTPLTDILKQILADPKKNKYYMGKVGNGVQNEDIKEWCQKICTNYNIINLASNSDRYSDLQYIMAYCARMAKIKKEGR